MQEWKRINKNLKDIWGRDPSGRPWFRIALSTQTEVKRGTFEVWHHGIFIREFTGTVEMPKYDFLEWDNPRWVLEKLIFVNLPDLPLGDKGTYEPVWVFYGPEGEYQKPVWKAVNLLVYMLIFGPKKTRADFMSMEEERFKKEVEMMEEIINDRHPWIADQLHEGSGIVVPSNFERGITQLCSPQP